MFSIVYSIKTYLTFKHKVTIGSRLDWEISDYTVKLNVNPSCMILEEIVREVSDNKIIVYGRQPDQTKNLANALILVLLFLQSADMQGVFVNKMFDNIPYIMSFSTKSMLSK